MNQFHYKAKTNIGDIEAIRYTDTKNIGMNTIAYPLWLMQAAADGRIYSKIGDDFLTAQGGHEIELDDSMWIVKLNDGELTAIPNHLFEALFAKSV